MKFPPLWLFIVYAIGIWLFFAIGFFCSGCIAWPLSGLERQDLRIIHNWRASQQRDTTWMSNRQ